MIDATTYIEKNLDGYIAELTEFASIPSVSSQSTGIAEAARWLQQALLRRGVDARILPTAGNPVVVGKIGAGKRTVLLYNHYDVQPPEPLDAWSTPPFEPTLRDGKLFGRGAIDDKGEIVARLAALDVLRERYGNELPLALTFFVEGEEESGSPNLELFVVDHRDLLAADACIWEAGQVDNQGRPQLWLGLRGMLYVELVARTLKHDAHSGWAHVLPNAAWRLIEALATLRDRDGNVTIDGFSDGLVGPTPRQRELLRNLPDETLGYREEYGIERFVAGREVLAMREAVFMPTCNISGIWAGHIEHGSKTVIPATAHVRIDFRLAPDQDPQRCLRALSAHLARHGFGDIEVHQSQGERAACSDPDHPFISLAIDVLRERYG
ncbi:MAG TPA: M20/M25/M40 family metallo-hydrolase, partial [Candidatus Aquilonibacter sp.]